jgi:hypothetical protein
LGGIEVFDDEVDYQEQWQRYTGKVVKLDTVTCWGEGTPNCKDQVSAQTYIEDQ